MTAAQVWPPTFDRDDIVVRGDALSWAVFSSCDKYRYLLGRIWDPALPIIVWVMLNPSTADHAKPDPTIRKCIGFSTRWGGGGIVVANMFGYRSTDADMLLVQSDPVGPWNEQAIEYALGLTAAPGGMPVVAGWGKIRTRWDARAWQVTNMLRGAAHCIGVNDNGTPRHPLMIAYATPRLPLAQARDNLRAGLRNGLPVDATAG
jgi:hypothetical protein